MALPNEICRSCGDLKALEGQGICASCFATLTGNLIPESNGGEITDIEYDMAIETAKKRMQWGRAKYEAAFNAADLKADLIEEIDDLINYAVFMKVRVQRAIPDFAGRLSSELIRKH